MRVAALLALAAGLFLAAPAHAHPDHEGSSERWTRKGPLKHFDARERARFREDLSYSAPFFVLGGLDLAAGIVVTAGTPYLEQGLVALVSGGLTVVGGFSLLIHTLVDWGLIGPKHDFWSGRPGLRLAVGPGVLVGRW